MKAERVGIAVIFIFLIIFTPLIEWVTDSLNISEPWNMIFMRAATGILLYLLSIYALSGLRADMPSKPKVNAGKRQINFVGIFIGIGLICVMWFTDLSTWVVNMVYTGQSTMHFLQWDVNIRYIFVRLVISVSTFIGVFLIKRSTARKIETQKYEHDDYLNELMEGV